MRTSNLVALFLLFSFASCSFERTELAAPDNTTGMQANASVGTNLLDFDIFQGTCALYVAIRSRALNEPVAFGRDIDDSMIHWNFCPGGTKVACKVVATADGDSIIKGIEWPYAKAGRH